MTNEAFSRVKIDAQLKDQGWEVMNANAVRFEYPLADGTKADYVLCDRNGRSLAVVEAKRASINPADAAGQAKAYAEQLNVPFIFLANGEEVRFWDWQAEAHPRVIKSFFSPGTWSGGLRRAWYGRIRVRYRLTGGLWSGITRRTALRSSPVSFTGAGARCWWKWQPGQAKPGRQRRS